MYDAAYYVRYPLNSYLVIKLIKNKQNKQTNTVCYDQRVSRRIFHIEDYQTILVLIYSSFCIIYFKHIFMDTWGRYQLRWCTEIFVFMGLLWFCLIIIETFAKMLSYLGFLMAFVINSDNKPQTVVLLLPFYISLPLLFFYLKHTSTAFGLWFYLLPENNRYCLLQMCSKN